VQTWLVGKVTSDLSKKLHTKVKVKHVDLRFFNQMVLEGLMIEDLKADTLLYAGKARVNINDWFFLKDRISFENVRLDDAIVNMKRSDSVWNYQFLVDYFVKPSTGNSSKEVIELGLREMHLNNIRFNKIDGWIGQNMVATIGKMDLTMDSLNLAEKRIAIKELYLERPFFSQSDYTGNRPDQPNLREVLEKIPVISAFKWNNSGWQMRVARLQIFDGSFKNDKSTEREIYTDRFDGQHLLFSSITGSMNNLYFRNDTLTTNISLTARERSGLLVKKLRADMRFTPEIMEFSNLDLVTNRSHLRDYYSMRYNAFNADMSSFIHNVTLEASFKESVLSSDDLAIFDPKLSSWNRNFQLEGSAKGTVDNFSTRNMKIRSGNTYIDGDIALRGLPNIGQTFIDLRARKLSSTYLELLTVAPALRNVTKPQLSRLGNFTFSGNYTGFLSDFVTYGTLSTALGSLTLDLNMKLPENNIPVYSGKVSTNGFNAGSFLGVDQLGVIALNGNIRGRGFNLNELNTDFEGDVRRLDLMGYTYQNIRVDGNFEKQLFTGRVSVDDPSLKLRSLEGTLNLSGKEIAFNVEADLASANLKNLGLSKDKLNLSGRFNLNFTGNNIDNFLGMARVYNATLQHDSTRLSFDSLTLVSQLRGNDKYLNLQSNEIDASLLGNFRVMELPDAFRVFLAKYYPSYIKQPKTIVSNQDFAFDIRTRNIDEYIRLFEPRLSGFNNSDITGSLKLNSYELKVNATVPEFGYDGKKFTNTVLTGTGNRDTLLTDIAIDDIMINDSLHLPDTRLHVAANNNLSLIKLTTRASETLREAELNASIQTLNDGVRIHFFPSSFVLNDKRWLLEKDGELTIRKNYIDANEVKFINNQQELVISTVLDDVTDKTHLMANLKNVVIEDILPFWVRDPKMEGQLTGEAIIRDPFGKTFIEFRGVADSFDLNDEYIGKVKLDATVNTTSGLVEFKTATDEGNYAFNLDGFYNYKDSIGNQMDINFMSERFNLRILEPYLGTIFSSIEGNARSNLRVSGGAGKKIITGEATIDSGSLVVAYTQCRYLFNNHTVKFAKDEIDIGRLRLRDTLNNEGVASGKMYHKFFREFSFEGMRFETGKMLLLNTTKKDNSQFYGNVIGRALVTMGGPVSNLQMNISGEPSILDSSHIYLPTGNTKENNAVDYIEFIQFGEEMDKVAGSQAANIVVNMNLISNPACQIDVILDEETGDIIKGRGNGQLNIRVGNREPMNIRGRYDITRGDYTFNFQTFIRKPFTLTRGSIVWNGDPYQAVIDMDAEYLAKNVDMSSINNTQQKEDITILSHLTGVLSKPVISFDFELPEKSELNRDYITVRRLADFKNDENVMNKQVASLLLFNSFISDQQNFLSQENTFAFATNTIGGVISGWLTNLFNKELEKATKGVISPYIDINPTLNLQNAASQLQANVRAGLKILLSSRLNIIIGGNLDYNNPYTQLDRKGLFTPDITIEWLLNKDGSLRVVAFNRTSILDPTTGQRNRSGGQLSYRKDFNRLSDIFKSRRKIREEAAKQEL